jgi:hypothetical protein
MHHALRRKDAVLDLHAPLRQAGQTRFHVHYGTSDRLDSLHERRLAGMANVTLHPHHGGKQVGEGSALQRRLAARPKKGITPWLT